MTTYLLALSYEGTHFNGWQIQKKHGTLRGRTIESELLSVLKKIPGFNGSVTGSSRTDSGVHAKAQAAVFSLEKDIPVQELLKRLTALLPEDIAPVSIKKVADGFNPRYKAKKKQYVYTIYNSPLRPVLDRNYVWWRKARLDIRSMQTAARYCTGTHDFKAFQKKNGSQKNTVCTIYAFSIKKKNRYITFSITGNRFLYNMVRNIVGSLVEVGRSKITPARFKTYLTNPDKHKAGPKAPAKGLILQKVYF